MSRNSYLELAKRAIERERQPLSPKQMLATAKKNSFLPPHLTGLTMHKTLMARLSEHIRKQHADADFFRTAPGRFFLHELARDPAIPEAYKVVHLGHRRSKAIKKENVLVVSKSKIEAEIFGEFVPYDEDQFLDIYRSICVFVDRSRAELDDTIKQFVTFTLFYHEDKILIHRRGKFTTTSENLKGQLSVGFGGHVNNEDFTLFSLGGLAFRANAARELREELLLGSLYKDFDATIDRTEILGFINVDGDADAEHHIAVLVAFRHTSDELPKKGELSINQISWLDLKSRKNDFSRFDFWSEIILNNLYNGRIKLPSGGA